MIIDSLMFLGKLIIACITFITSVYILIISASIINGLISTFIWGDDDYDENE